MSNEQDREREELEQLLAAEALSANDFDDAADRALMNKLLEDGELAEDFESYQEAAAQLALAVEPVQPPASMKDALFAKLDSFPQQNPVGDEREVAASAGRQQAADAPRAEASDLDGSEGETGRTLRAVADDDDAASDSDADDDRRLVAVGGGTSSQGSGEDDFGPVETRARGRWFRNSAQAMFAATAAVVVAVGLFLGGGLAFGGFGQDSQDPPLASGDVALILAASDVDSARTEVAGGGTVTVYWSEELGQSAVVAHGMAQLPAENDYELWYIDGEGPAPAGILTMADGAPAVRVLDGTFAPGMAVGVTVESKGGSATGEPTTPPIAVVQS
ncbi:anti-sigma factor domain-containing protein [Pseudoclavibacter helvolus]|uniref:anti-sigma factor domain-containing protein n=1 Tax=Pseudoclavibacter helvolus TaxID=255205 RepID=UPI003C72F83D